MSTISKTPPPLVSAIVPTYNAARFLPGLLDSLVEQTIADRMEIIVVDTDSQTNEWEIVKPYLDKYSNISYVRTSYRESGGEATNKGIQLAKGKYIIPAPTDDRLRVDALEVMANELENNSHISLVYADVFITMLENQTFAHHKRWGYSIRFDYGLDMMLTGYHMGPLTMWKRSLHDSVGFFDDKYLCANDYDFYCRVALEASMKHIPKFLGLYLRNTKGVVYSNPDKSALEFSAIRKFYQDKFPPPIKKPFSIYFYSKTCSSHKYVNICMVTFNRLEFTKSAITSILQFTCFPHVLTVVDNGSTDGTVEYLQAMKKEGIITNLILLKENVGVAKASNLAWSQEPEAEYYMKFDNDIVIQKSNWLERMVEVLDAVPDLAMVGYNFEPKSYPIQAINGQQVRPTRGNLGGACVMIPKRTEEQLGFWCEDYGLYGEEDADYGCRSTLSGLKHAYMEDEGIGIHLPAGRAASINPETLVAEDGIEEHQYVEYRRFKDQQRHVNIQGATRENFERYQTGRKPLYCQSAFVQTFQADMLERVPLAAPQSQLSACSTPVTKCQDSHQVKRRVSVIANDPFCGGLRLIYPLSALLSKEQLTGQMLIEADIWNGRVELPAGVNESVVVQRVANCVEPRLKAVKLQGTRIVHDFDDLLWKIPQDNQNFQVITRPMLECFFRVMAQADCVTVSTEPLRDALSVLGIPATVLPNCLHPVDWNKLTTQRYSGRRPRVGWVGQVGVHREDVAILLPLMEMLGQEVEWVFLGEIPEIPSGVQCDVESHAMVTLQDYPAKLASLNLDLALAPLALNEFNEAKSDLRILQYGILGYPVVASDIIPYQVAPVTRVSNDAQSWARAIRDHINNRASSEAQGEQLRLWVLSHRMFDQWASQYQAAWLGELTEGKQMSESKNIPRFSLQESPSISEAVKVSFDCSIIIPVFNKLELTRQCLTHLAKVTHGCSYEVIVVDNASTDGTGPFLSSLEGDIHFVTNDSNLGFAKACNQGARVAKGKYLVFLNNDTIPQEGWLSALVDEVEQHPDVAIVGSKLLYPNDTIQHAGVVFSKKWLMPYLIFRNCPSDYPAFNMRQEFQAVTAACLLIRKEDFESVSGFDESFMNGFEDVDLCLKIRESGRKVIYQPKSVLYHLEAQTSGRKDPEAERRNGRLFLDRWSEKIVIDEDVYAVSVGYANRYSSDKETFKISLKSFENEVEKSQWERVKTVQELLLQRRYDSSQLSHEQLDVTLRTNLSDAWNWPEDVDVLKWAATVCRLLECVESECAFLKRVLSLEDDRAAREKLATQALKHGDLSEASQHVQALLALNPHDGPGLWLQAILAMQSLEYTKAVESFQQALAVGYDEKKTGLGLGMAWMGVGDAAKSWDAFQSVMMAHPDNQDAVNGLLQSGTALQRWKELIEQLTRYVDRNPVNCDMRFTLAGVCYRAGNVMEARKHYEILQVFSPEYEGLEDLGQRLQSSQELEVLPILDQAHHATFYDNEPLQSYYQPPTGNTETYIRVLLTAVVDHTVAVHQALKEYDISGFGTGLDAVEEILSIVFQRQFAQPLVRSCDMWDRVVALTVDCKLVHGITGTSFFSLQPHVLEDIDATFAQQEGETRKREIFAYLEKLRNGESLGKPLYISGKILQYLGAPAEDHAMYMLDGARRLSASALHHQERMPVLLLVFEEEFAQLLLGPVKTGIQHRIQQLAWFQNYHSFPFLDIAGQRSLQRFKLMETERLKDSVIVDFGCNLGQASLKAIQCGAQEVWGIEGMQDTIAIANEIQTVAGCKNLQYLHVDFNDPQFDQHIDQRTPEFCDYAFFFSVYRTKELTQRDRLFQYILNKTKKGVFFEGHAHPQIDTLEYYDWLFESFNVRYTFLGYSEQHIRPLFYLDLENRSIQQQKWPSLSTSSLHSPHFTETVSQQDNLVKSR